MNEFEKGEYFNSVRNRVVMALAPIVAVLALSACTEQMKGEKEEQNIINGREFWVNESETVVVVSDTIERKTPAVSKTNDIERIEDGDCRIVKNPIYARVDGSIFMAFLPQDKDLNKDEGLTENLNWIAYQRLSSQTQPQEQGAPYVVSKGEPIKIDGKDVEIDGLKISTQNTDEVSVSRIIDCEDATFIIGLDENPEKGE